MAEDGLSSEQPISILLVDDREEDLLAIEVILEGPGIRLVKAAGGNEALRAVLREDFALILLDVTMPGMEGFEVARFIKQRDKSKHIPVIFLTAESRDVGSIYRGYEVGGVDYILKPLDAAVVKAKVSVFVELHRRGREIQRQAELLREAERQRRESELAELRWATEKRYRNLAEAIPQVVWTADPAGEITYFNQRWMSLTGFTLSQSLGGGWQSAVHPNDVTRFVEQWQRALTTIEPLRAECRLRGTVGTYRFYLCEALPERDENGAVIGWLGTFTDVNEHKQIEEERGRALLREQMARAEVEMALRRLEFLAEASHLLTRSLDAQGIITGLVEIATPRLCSWCVVDVVKNGVLAQAAFAHEDEARRALGAALAERTPLAPEATSGIASVLGRGTPEAGACDANSLAAALSLPDAGVVEQLGASAYVSVPLSARGQVLGAMTLVSARADKAFGPADVALAVDLGQRAALAIDNAHLYEAAQRAVRIREEFLSIASHELRTPLAALELQTQSIRVQLGKDEVDLPRITAKAAVVERQVDRLARLISEMLDVSRIEAGRLELDCEDVDLDEVIHDVVARFAGELERAGSQLVLSIPDRVRGSWDRSRLDQVVTNLLHNAIKYGRGQPVQVSLERQNGYAVLRVEDGGIGISPADQARIFQRFERAVSARQYGGMGVGLFIVDRIVRAHAGRIEVSSEPNKGSTFVVHLPLGEVAQPSRRPPELEAQPEA